MELAPEVLHAHTEGTGSSAWGGESQAKRPGSPQYPRRRQREVHLGAAHQSDQGRAAPRGLQHAGSADTSQASANAAGIRAAHGDPSADRGNPVLAPSIPSIRLMTFRRPSCSIRWPRRCGRSSSAGTVACPGQLGARRLTDLEAAKGRQPGASGPPHDIRHGRG